MSSLTSVTISKKEIRFISAGNIREIPDFNYRTKRENRDQLKDQILEAGGVKTPITGYFDEDVFFVVSGIGRVTLSQELIAEGHAIAPIPTISIPKPTDDEGFANLLLSQIIDNDSESLDPIGLANLCNDLKIRYGWTNRKIAEKTGRKEAIVGRYLTVLSDPKLSTIVNSPDSPSLTLIADVQIEHGNDASEILAEATAIAVTEGKPKATKKHVNKALENPRKPSSNPMKAKKSEIQTMRDLITTLVIDQQQRDLGDVVAVDIEKALWLKLQSIAGVES